MSRFYATTPIYYVNDRPHIGHVYSTTVVDVFARYHRLAGKDVFFLTGTDEHAAKVADAAAAHGLSPLAWADKNAAEFAAAFSHLGFTNDDFIRTTESRHKERVEQYVRQLLESGDVYAGEYSGWYDAGQEEYVPETKAKEAGFLSVITKKPLERRTERNYFFRLSRYADELLALLASRDRFDVRPEARRNEVVARIADGLNDVPISRTGGGDWGIRFPGDPEQTIYVWIDALFNYLSAVDTDERRRFWPADVHVVAKDILWFHAVIWPAMLLALSRQPGNEWIELPRLVYCHSFWIRDGQKMSKSLGNFVDLEQIDACVGLFGLDGLRYFLATQGPMGTADSDFSATKLLEVYNADLANTFGNCLNRVCHMTARYFGGALPAAGPEPAVGDEGGEELAATAARCAKAATAAYESLDLAGAASAALELVKAVDGFITRTSPFKLAKDPAQLPVVGTILYRCAEALRIAAVLLLPVIPERASEALRRLGRGEDAAAVAGRGQGQLAAWLGWGLLDPGTPVVQGEPLFPRLEAEVLAKLPGGKPAALAAVKEEARVSEPISIDKFFETQLKAGTVLAAQPVPKSSKLLQLTVDLGEETPRTIVAGIATAYSPEDLVGQQVVVVANLQPAKLMGVESQGMVLAASLDGKPVVVRPIAKVPPGTQVR